MQEPVRLVCFLRTKHERGLLRSHTVWRSRYMKILSFGPSKYLSFFLSYFEKLDSTQSVEKSVSQGLVLP